MDFFSSFQGYAPSLQAFQKNIRARYSLKFFPRVQKHKRFYNELFKSVKDMLLGSFKDVVFSQFLKSDSHSYELFGEKGSDDYAQDTNTHVFF